MYVNAKMIPVETVSAIRGVGLGERSGGGNSNMIYLKHCKNLCKSYKCVPPPSTTIKKINFIKHNW
jgi:hypothetical protein